MPRMLLLAPGRKQRASASHVNYGGPPLPCPPCSILSPGRKKKTYAMHLRVTEDERGEDGTLTVKFELMASVSEA